MVEKTWQKMGLSDEEYERICSLMAREPGHLELGMFGVMWSEHCSYKNSKPLLKKFPTKGPQVLQGPGENAGIVDIGDGLAVAFKVESHNHPSAIEPFSGAATGVGGVTRDIFAMGARPIALLNSLRFGPLEKEKVQYLLKEAVAGIAFYGQGLNVPTAGGEVKFAAAYEGNPLVNAMCVGLVRKDAVVKGYAGGIGNPVFLLGARTGRDGVEGASFASEELEADKEQRSTVPTADPELERKLIEACLELVGEKLVVGMQDLGAAGFTSSAAEMAARAGAGIELDMDLVLTASPDLTPYEIMLSETQERMLLVAPRGKEEEVMAIGNKWGVETTLVGQVIDSGTLRVVKGGQILADVPATALTDDAPVYQRKGLVPDYLGEVQTFSPEDLPEPTDYNEALLKVLSSPNVCDKSWVFKQMKEPEGDNTLIPPGSDAGVIQIPGSKKAIAITLDGNGRYCYLDPYRGGKAAVAEAARNLVCVGARPLALTDGLNFGSPENLQTYWQVEQMIDGMVEACETLELPVVSGNVSAYNESQGQAIYPTPIVGMVGLLEDREKHLSSGFKQVGDLVVLLGDTYPEVGGSEYLSAYHDIIAGKPPRVDLEKEQRVHKLCLAAIDAGILRSAHDCAEGGLVAAVAESCLTSTTALGVNLELNEIARPDFLLFSESHGRIVVSLAQDEFPVLQDLAVEKRVPLQILGRVVESNFRVGSSSTTDYRTLIDLELTQLSAAWSTLEGVFAGANGQGGTDDG